MTKHDGEPLLAMLKLNIKKNIHFSITTLGGSKFEPGVMKWNDMMDRIEALINTKHEGKQLLDPNSVTIRIDPIIPGVTNFADVEALIQRAKALGINKYRFSVLDSYGEGDNVKNRLVIKSMQDLGYDWS
jgi:DNA repair photolyase